ncbi:hypothetical protein [Streptomyces chartreusis]|nr:hypothetical protein [Streptomyces chartreusis]
MKKPFALAAAVAVMAAVLVTAPYASAATGPAHDKPVVSGVKTAVAAGESAENITVSPDGSLTNSQIGTPVGKPPKLERINPSGERTALVTRQAGDGILGNTRGPDGTLYYNVLSADAARPGVWKLPPGGAPQRKFPNGLAIDPSGHTLYNAIAVVHPDETRKSVLTSADGLTSPTATAVRGKRLYITDAGFAAPNIAKLQTGQINLSALFCDAVS